jgi:hypothetical protein
MNETQSMEIKFISQDGLTSFHLEYEISFKTQRLNTYDYLQKPKWIDHNNKCDILFNSRCFSLYLSSTSQRVCAQNVLTLLFLNY